MTGKLVRWLAARGYVDGESAADVTERAKDASRDLPSADPLGSLLHDVADRAPEIDINAIAEQDWVEDSLQISDVQPGRIWFEGGIGPISVPRKASDLARPGWSVFVTLARTAGTWRLLGSASCTPEKQSGASGPLTSGRADSIGGSVSRTPERAALPRTRDPLRLRPSGVDGGLAGVDVS